MVSSPILVIVLMVLRLLPFEKDASVPDSVINERLVVDRKKGAVAKLIGLMDGVGNELKGELGGRAACGSIVRL